MQVTVRPQADDGADAWRPRSARRHGDTLLPRLDGRCLAWADVFDSRRFASLAASGEHDNGRAYPQRTFDDLTEARGWATSTGSATAAPAGGE